MFLQEGNSLIHTYGIYRNPSLENAVMVKVFYYSKHVKYKERVVLGADRCGYESPSTIF